MNAGFFRYLLWEMKSNNRLFKSSDSTFDALRRKTGTI